MHTVNERTAKGGKQKNTLLTKEQGGSHIANPDVPDSASSLKISDSYQHYHTHNFILPQVLTNFT